MSEVRMSLSEAATLLGIKPNSVRSRFKAGKLQGERDNSGKIWVLIDPNKIANDKGSKKRVSKPSIEAFETNEIKALKEHIKTLSQQLEGANEELKILRPQVSENVRLQTELNGMEKQVEISNERISELREDLTEAQNQKSKILDELIAAQKRRKWPWQK